MYSPSSFPSPLKSDGNSSFGESCEEWSTAAIRVMSFRLRIADHPRRDLVSRFAT